jgi:hypothetical protein
MLLFGNNILPCGVEGDSVNGVFDVAGYGVDFLDFADNASCEFDTDDVVLVGGYNVDGVASDSEPPGFKHLVVAFILHVHKLAD